MTNKIEELITSLAFDPSNPELNLKTALEYEALGQIAAAISFYLRTAEYGYKTHTELTYTSLLRMSLCFESQNNRNLTVSNALLQAIAYQPERPEAYFLMSKFHEGLKNWQECYTFASVGLTKIGSPALPVGVGYHGEYCLQFEKAVSAWWIGRKEESRGIFTRLKAGYLSPEYLDAVKKNLGGLDNAITF